MSWNFCSKNSFDDVTWNFELALLSRTEIFAKIGSLDDVTQKFDLPLLSQAEIFHKIKPFWWFHLKVWPGLIIMRQPFPQNKAVLLMWFEILNYPYYYKVKFSLK